MSVTDTSPAPATAVPAPLASRPAHADPRVLIERDRLQAVLDRAALRGLRARPRLRPIRGGLS